jgi:hypothetical protein
MWRESDWRHDIAMFSSHCHLRQHFGLSRLVAEGRVDQSIVGVKVIMQGGNSSDLDVVLSETRGENV